MMNLKQPDSCDDMRYYLKALRQRLDPNTLILGEYQRLSTRKGRPVSQEEIAEAVGVTRAWYALLESGAPVQPSVSLLHRLAGALNATPRERGMLFSTAFPELRGIDCRTKISLNSHFDLENAVALVTGANRGIGRAYVERLAQAGASAVYAAARNLASLAELVKAYPSVIPLYLDVRDPHSIAEAASRANNVNVLVNNAGVAQLGGITGSDSFEDARQQMEVNYFGLLAMSRAFAPILVANAPSAMINVLSIASLIGTPRLGTYGASKAAALSATRTIRAELATKGVHVLGVMPGFVDTDMTADFNVEKISASDVVDATFAALAAGREEVYPGAQAAQLADAYFSNHKTLEKQMASFV